MANFTDRAFKFNKTRTSPSAHNVFQKTWQDIRILLSIVPGVKLLCSENGLVLFQNISCLTVSKAEPEWYEVLWRFRGLHSVIAED
jgi:hypothetical protein